MTKKSKTWKSIPLEKEIITIIIDNRGEILTTDLLRLLSNKYQDFLKYDLNDILFKLEVRSYIHVIPIKKDVNKIELNRYGKFSEELMKKIRKFMH